MVRLIAHGGHCCGARHLFGFGENENRDPDSIITALRNAPPKRQVEVILNGDQIASYPHVLDKLADLGFVYTGHYINGNHMSNNHVFTRCDDRLPLVNADGTCAIPNWRGQVLTPGTRGQLPNPARLAGGGIRRNSEVRVNSPTSRRHGGVYTVRDIRDVDYVLKAIMFDPMTHSEFAIVLTNLELVNAPVEAQPPRHDQPDAPNGAYIPPVVPPARGLRQEEVPVIRVFSTFHNVYRMSGRMSGYDTLEEARAKTGRNALRLDRRDIMSDGSVRWVEGIN